MNESTNTPDPQRDPVPYITRQIGETTRQARGRIWRIVHECGAAQALDWLREAQAIESGGGMLTSDGTRRRTPGGVFFKLARDALGGAGTRGDTAAMDRYRAIFGVPQWQKRAQARGGSPPTPPPPPVLPLRWEERVALWRALEATSGVATSLKLELTGKPDQVVEKERQTLVELTHHGTLPPVAHAIPTPPDPVSLAYHVVISTKHWKPAQERAPGGLLSFSGVSLYDPELEGMRVFVLGPVKLRDPDDRLAAGDLKPPSLTVVGQIGTPLVRTDMTLARMVSTGPLPALPKGLVGPDPLPSTPLGLYISAKAWKKIASALAQDPADVLIGTGTPYYDAELAMVAVHITTVTTRALDRAQRQHASP